MLEDTTNSPVYDMSNAGFSKFYVREAPTLVLTLCSFCDTKNATFTEQEGKYKVVYKSSTMTYTKYDEDNIAQAEGLIVKCPACGKQLIRDEEKWAPIINHHNYQVSTKGRIKSFAQDPDGKVSIGGKVAAGYLHTTFDTDRNGKYVHDLVAYAFIPNDHGFRCVNHKNHVRTDNRIENVEWCTHSYNNSGVDRKNFVKSVDKIAQLKDGHFVAFFDSYSQAAKATGLSTIAILQATRGISIYAGGYEWQVIKPISRKQKQHDYEEFKLL